MRRSIDVSSLLLVSAVLMMFGCGKGTEPGEASPELATITQGLVIPERSIVVTDEDILKEFHLIDVLERIIATSNSPGMSALGLFNQWWDTQNPGPGLGAGPHCDDEIVPPGVPGHNGFPWQCPRAEGFQAHIDPFKGKPHQHLYQAIGIFNRFDLAPANGIHCGEYRIVFAMRPGHQDAQGRNFMIFEAVMPNPDPNSGIQGCFEVAEYWYKLSFMDDPVDRTKHLQQFFFKGFGQWPAAIDVKHFGTILSEDGYGCSTGQIRTNQFVQDPWNLREFRMVDDCRCGTCFLLVAPTTVKNNPYGPLFEEGHPHPMTADLQDSVLNQVWPLGNGGMNQIGWNVPNAVNSGESLAELFTTYHYLNLYDGAPGIAGGFKDVLQSTTNSVWGGILNDQNIVQRAETQSCAGCHHTTNGADLGNGVTWLPSLKFVHVEEFPSGGHFPVSLAMEKEFIPWRTEIFWEYLNNGGTSNGSNAKCEFKIPPELEVDCASPAVKDVTRRPFKSSGLEKMKFEIKGTLGGSLVH